MHHSVFCFGLGYSALELGRKLDRLGFTLCGTARSEASLAGLAAQGLRAQRFDRQHPLDWAASGIAGASHLLISVPPDEIGDPVLDLHQDAIAKLKKLSWIGYLSTTGVYGDRGGDWVDEKTPPAPTSDRGARRHRAEQGWLALGQRAGIGVQIFRLPGIYGPGRSVFDQLRAGTAKRIAKPGQVFSRIHVEDIAATLAASIARPRAGGIYNVADDLPAAPAEVVEYAARLLQMPPPPLQTFEEAELSEMARSFYSESKRVSNRLIKEELGVRLRYPTYREGLAAILQAENNP